MVLIVCIDKNNGMLFNNRRQSKDKVVTQYIIDLVANKKLWINNFSKDLFEEYAQSNLIIDDDFINKIGQEDYCFIENISPTKLEDKVDKIVVYNWNRTYPSDESFNISLDNWICESETEFIGNSHDKITETIYIRGNK